MKKITILLIAALLSVASAFAQSGTTGPLTWNFNSDTLTISGCGAMPDYATDTEVPWYDFRRSIHTVVMDSCITSIGNFAFYYCDSLTSVNIPDSITTIGNSAFDSCRRLTSITIPDSMTTITIGNLAFQNCSVLTKITIPATVTSVGFSAFKGCSGLTEITIPFVGNSETATESDAYFGYIFGGNYNNVPANLKKVTIIEPCSQIPASAFYRCSNLTSVIIPNSITTIGNEAFYYCYNLPSVTIPDNVATIGIAAFDSCRSLTKIIIPQAVTYIGNSAFKNCSGLTEITIPFVGNSETATESNAYFGYIFGGNYHNIPANLKKVTITEPCIQIPASAFSDCNRLTDIIIPKTVTSVGNFAFYNCSALTSITFPDSAASVRTIGQEAFSKCTGLTSITIPASVTTIGNYAFASCKKIPSITIPNNVTTINEGAFWNCDSLKTINFNATNCTTMGNQYTQVFSGCDSLKTLNIGNQVETIPYFAFYNCNRLDSVFIPESVTSIGLLAFSGCTGLRIVDYNATNSEITVHVNGTTYSDFPFDGCTALTTINIGKNVEKISNHTFSGRNFTSITSHATTPPVLGTNTFYGTPKNIPVYIPCASYNSYMNDIEWKKFTNIKGPAELPTDKNVFCMISVDKNNHNELIWKKQEKTSSYKIYREGTTAGQYNLLTTVDDSAPNIWVDMESNANTRSYRYKISAVGGDCNIESVLSSEHKTMYLTISAGSENSWKLTWTPYVGATHSTYNIYRASGETAGEYTLICITAAGSDNPSFIDYGAPEGYVYYKVEIPLSTPCETTYSAIKSNVATNNPNVIIQPEVSKLTVYPNPTNGELQVTGYELQVGNDYRIFNVMGQMVMNGKLADETATINVGSLPNGIYYLRIGNAVTKIVKN